MSLSKETLGLITHSSVRPCRGAPCHAAKTPSTWAPGIEVGQAHVLVWFQLFPCCEKETEAKREGDRETATVQRNRCNSIEGLW